MRPAIVIHEDTFFFLPTLSWSVAGCGMTGANEYGPEIGVTRGNISIVLIFGGTE